MLQIKKIDLVHVGKKKKEKDFTGSIRSLECQDVFLYLCSFTCLLQTTLQSSLSQGFLLSLQILSVLTMSQIHADTRFIIACDNK